MASEEAVVGSGIFGAGRKPGVIWGQRNSLNTLVQAPQAVLKAAETSLGIAQFPLERGHLFAELVGAVVGKALKLLNFFEALREMIGLGIGHRLLRTGSGLGQVCVVYRPMLRIGRVQLGLLGPVCAGLGALLISPAALAGDLDGVEILHNSTAHDVPLEVAEVPSTLNLASTSLQEEAKTSTPQPAPTSEPAKLDLKPVGVKFGDAESMWFTLGGGAANNGQDTDFNIFGSLGYFIAQDVEFFGELGAWQYNQPGKDATGLNLSMVIRWHFLDTGKWTMYGDIGIGVMVSTDPVPVRDGAVGTDFNFTPRLGGGVTRQISDDGTRLELGLRWAHVSNGRISGNDNNPGRDSLMLYGGIIFPF